MSHPFRVEAAAAAASAFADWGEAVVYTPAPSAEGAPVETRAIDRTADVIALQPRLRARQVARTLEIPTTAIPARPTKGATIVAGMLTYTVLEDAQSDDAFGLVWTCSVSLSLGPSIRLQLTLPPPQLVAGVSLGIPPSGLDLAAMLEGVTLIATSFVPVAGGVSVQLSAPVLAATALRTDGGSAFLDVALAAPTVSSTAVADIAAGLDMALSAPTVAFAAALGLASEHPVALSAPSLAASAVADIAPALAITLAAPDCAASALITLGADLAFTLPTPELSAEAQQSAGPVASLALTLDAPALSAEAVSSQAAALAVTLAAPALAAEGLVGVVPYAGATLDAPGLSASAAAPAAAALDHTLPMPGVEIAGLVAAATVNAYTLAAPGIEAAVILDHTAALTFTLSTPSLTGAAEVDAASAAAANVPMALLSGTSTAAIAAALSFTAPFLTVSATADVEDVSSSPAVFRSAATSTSTTCNRPPGTASGDLLIACIPGAPQGQSITPPSGWTLIDRAQQAGDDIFGVAYWKIAGGSEPSSYTFTATGNDFFAMAILRYDGHDPVTPIGPSTDNSGSGTTRTALGITTPEDNCILVAFIAATGTSTTTPSGMTQRAEILDGLDVYDQTIATAGATGNRTNTGSSSGWVAVMLAIRPA
jgi:hypothetical protein